MLARAVVYSSLRLRAPRQIPRAFALSRQLLSTTTTPQMAVNLTPDGGIKKEVLAKGWGDATPPHGSQVSAHYVGKLVDGTVFDSSKKRGKPFSFQIGVGQVIKGWDIGMGSMVKGEKAVLTITSTYGYGSRGAGGVIPGGATLIFEVEMIDFM